MSIPIDGPTKAALIREAASILHILTLAYPQGRAVVSGGFMRDIACGICPKDMDVFVQSDEADGMSPVLERTLERNFGTIDWMRRHYKPVQFGTCVRIGNVPRIPPAPVASVPVQIILLSRGVLPEDDARLNDFGICQIWFDGRRPNATKAFFADIERKTFTLSVCENRSEFKRSMRRWERLKDKFPEHRLVIPPCFEHYAVEHAWLAQS